LGIPNHFKRKGKFYLTNASENNAAMELISLLSYSVSKRLFLEKVST